MVKLEACITNSSRNIGLGLVSLLGSEWYHSTILSTQFVQVQNFKCSILLYFYTRLTREWEMLILNHELISVDILPPILSSLLFSGLQKLKHHYLRSKSHGNNNRSCHEWCWSGVLLTKLGRYRSVLVQGWVLMILGHGLLILLDVNIPSSHWIPIFILVGISHGPTMMGLIVCIQAAAPREDVSYAASVYTFMRSLGRVSCGDWSHGLSKHYGSTPSHVFTAYHDSKQR